MYKTQRYFAYLSKLSPYIIVVTSLFVILAFLMLAQYSHPSADDYCVASGIKEHGPLEYLWNHYLEWSGRYSGDALYGLYPLIFGLTEGYFLIPIILIVSLGMSFAYLVSIIFKISQFSIPSLVSSVCFITVYMLGMSSTAQGFYWMAGALSYQTGNILTLILIGLSIQLYDHQKDAKQYSTTLILLIIACIIAMGLNETILLLIAGYIGIATIQAYRSKVASVKPWLIMSALAVICFCIVYFSPGNDVRSSHFKHANDISLAITKSWEYGLNSLSRWVTNPVLILSSILSLFLFYILYSASNRGFHVTIKQIIYLLSLTIASPFIFSFPVSWAIGGTPPARLDDTIYFLFIIFWYSSIAAILFYIIRIRVNHIFERFRHFKNIIITLTMIIYIYFISVNMNLAVALNDLKNNAFLHDKYLNKRYNLIEKSVVNRIEVLSVPDYDYDYPKSIYFADITRDVNDWTNVCYANYYGLDQIRID